MIEFNNVTFGYDNEREVFSNLSFSVCAGEKIGIIGANGSGKTTLFHLIMGLVKPQGGTISILDVPRSREKDFREVRRKFGLIFQDPNDQLFSPTVEEDIAFGPLNLGHSHRDVGIIVDQVCSELRISHLKKRSTFHLSGGEKRLVALASVMAMRPSVYLFDEPTAGLDEGARKDFIRTLEDKIKSCLIISHDLSLLERTSDKIYHLRQVGGISKCQSYRFAKGIRPG